jgi:flagellar hook-length control protein FliK
MPSLSITPPAKTSAPPPASRGASPPPGAAGDFAALLDQTSARTAPAEGPKNRPAQTEQRRRDAADPKDDNKGAAASDAQAVPVAEPAPAQSQPVTESTQGQTPSGEQPATPVAPTGDPAAATAAPVAAVPIAAPATPVAPGTAPATAAAVVAQAAAGATTAQPGSADGATPAAAAASTDGTPAGKLQIPAELLNAKADANGGQTKDFKNGDQSQRDLPPAPTLPPTADAAATPTAAPAAVPSPPADPGAATGWAGAGSTVALQAQPAVMPPTAIPVANGGVGGTVLTRASVLQTAERVQELVRIATTRAGNARAILQLRPAELGQVDVHLRTTRNGLVATIAAHEQVGLDALQQAGNELRRTLEDKGVQLHSLDLQLGTGNNGFSNQGDAREASSGRRGAAAVGGADSPGNDDDLVADELTITHAPSTPAGALVDVQA